MDDRDEIDGSRPPGLGVDDLPWVYREQFVHVVEMVRAEHDPGEEWIGFREALWEALVPAFGLDVIMEEDAGGRGGQRASRGEVDSRARS